MSRKWYPFLQSLAELFGVESTRDNLAHLLIPRTAQLAPRLRSTTGRVSLDESAHFKPGESHIGFFLVQTALGSIWTCDAPSTDNSRLSLAVPQPHLHTSGCSSRRIGPVPIAGTVIILNSFHSCSGTTCYFLYIQAKSQGTRKGFRTFILSFCWACALIQLTKEQRGSSVWAENHCLWH